MFNGQRRVCGFLPCSLLNAKLFPVMCYVLCALDVGFQTDDDDTTTLTLRLIIIREMLSPKSAKRIRSARSAQHHEKIPRHNMQHSRIDISQRCSLRFHSLK